ncbi:MAG: xanthine dehydrogenase family protein subunit M [Proteobacteria bacterium]|nr:xanthine dehydrogenase family protein subunit M [Pseudomonadota bacterium]
MRLHQPTTIAEAIGLLADGSDAKCLAGGQTLAAMMNAELIEPDALVSLKKIPQLHTIEVAADNSVRLGAMVTHASIASYAGFTPGQEIVMKAAQVIAHPAVRNAGTIGGSIVHADPAADYPAALVAADAIVTAVGPGGTRVIPIAAFFIDYLETLLAEGEIVTAIELPAGPANAVTVYEKIARVDGDFATLSLALVGSRQRDEFTSLRIALGSAGPIPVRVEEAEQCLIGRVITPSDVEKAAAALSAACDPIDDIRGSSAYRLKLVPRVLARAVQSELS